MRHDLFILAIDPIPARPGTGELVKILGGFGVKVKHACQGVDHLIRRTAFSALLQPHVVVDTDPRQQSHLIAAQARRAPAVVTAWQAGLFGGHELTPSTEELGKGAPHTGQSTKGQVKAAQNEGSLSEGSL
ncbi:hypothetical protein GCM10023193_70660 [Planotetraspora kaengkrachanensis]|uniref:Uncharacterized protein n=1 Tax=Planotetraspora kaengkrachanensis TaxID=575193 RepID=A0A8J3PYY3_9ACTN|nr:hypothetical protein Pka01_67450 [Planotetraspora kaengkrachanensis]